MQNQTILTVVGIKSTAKTLGPLAEKTRGMSAHLAVTVAASIPPYPMGVYGSMPYGQLDIPVKWQEDYTASVQCLDQKRIEIQTLLQNHGTSGDVTLILDAPVNIDAAIANRARVCDFAWVSHDLRDEKGIFDHILRGILFGSPTGVLVNEMQQKKPLDPQHIMIAWNTSLPSARAVHAALPMLINTDKVTIACFDPVMTEFVDGEDPGSDLARWLSHCGCNVTLQQYPSGGKEIGECVLERSVESGADMVVMGAYGHARTRQAVFGGTTRTMIEQTDLPVFLAH